MTLGDVKDCLKRKDSDLKVLRGINTDTQLNYGVGQAFMLANRYEWVEGGQEKQPSYQYAVTYEQAKVRQAMREIKRVVEKSYNR